MNVHQCPQNKNDWDTASQKLQCVEPNSYHCLRTEDGEETEQCLGKVWIQEGMCPEYNSKVNKIDVSSCKSSQGCPAEIYWSNEVYKYPTCSGKITLETTTASLVGDSDLPVNGKETIYIIMILSIVVFVISIVLVIWFIKRKIQTTRERNIPNEDRLTPELSPLTVNDANSAFGIRQTHERSTRTGNDTHNEYRCTRRLSPTTVHDTSNRYRVIQEPSPHTVEECTHGANPDIDSPKSDVKDLKKHGVLLFISSDKNEMGQRMKFIVDSEIFGKSRFEHSLNLWEPDEDVSLYLFRQPVDNWSNFLENAPNIMENMLKKLNDLPKTYFVLYFSVNEWQTYKNRLLKYDFFVRAKTK